MRVFVIIHSLLPAKCVLFYPSKLRYLFAWDAYPNDYRRRLSIIIWNITTWTVINLNFAKPINKIENQAIWQPWSQAMFPLSSRNISNSPKYRFNIMTNMVSQMSDTRLEWITKTIHLFHGCYMKILWRFYVIGIGLVAKKSNGKQQTVSEGAGWRQCIQCFCLRCSTPKKVLQNGMFATVRQVGSEYTIAFHAKTFTMTGKTAA